MGPRSSATDRELISLEEMGQDVECVFLPCYLRDLPSKNLNQHHAHSQITGIINRKADLCQQRQCICAIFYNVLGPDSDSTHFEQGNLEDF